MHPRPGTAFDNARGRLQQLISTVDTRPEPIDYAMWVAGAETVLRELFVDVPFERLYTERYWRLTTGPVLRHHDMLRNERHGQREWLENVLGVMGAMTERFSKPASAIGVVDSHVVMHAKPLGDIDWCSRFQTPSVRLVVPLRVVDELDEKKYARREDLRKRARNRLRLLGRYLQQPDEIRQGVRVEVVSWYDLDVGGIPRRAAPPDVEILDTCEALRVYAAANAVSLVTADVGMTLRARDRDIPVVALSDEDMQSDLVADEG